MPPPESRDYGRSGGQGGEPDEEEEEQESAVSHDVGTEYST